MRHAGPTRKELGIRTVFNLLGPLTNPAGAEHQLLGVFQATWVEPVARVLAELGTRHSLVVHGGGLDEATLEGPTLVAEVRNGSLTTYLVRPEEAGLQPAAAERIRGGDAAENARRGEAVLLGVPGPDTDIVVFNAGLALYAADLVPSLADGVAAAREAIQSGRATGVLSRLRAWRQVSA